jgi:hypothetical protein
MSWIQSKLFLYVEQILPSNSSNQVSKESHLWTVTLGQFLKESQILTKDSLAHRGDSTGQDMLHQVVM